MEPSNPSSTNISITKSLLQSSLESLKDVLIFSIDKKYRYLHFNNAFKIATKNAYGTEVKTGISMLDTITNAEDRAKAKMNCDRAVKGESHTTLEVFGDLEKSYFETRYAPFYDNKGDIMGVTVLSSNVTDRKMAEEKIKALNHELEAFSYTVAHDLRSPLRIINSYCSIIMEDHSPVLDQDIQQLLKVIADHTDRMGKMIEDLLNFAKLGKSEVEKRKINTTRLVHKVLAELEIKPSNRLQIDIKKLPIISADYALMNLVFSNLISNAAKYSKNSYPAKIEVGTIEQHGNTSFYVKDNGAGFDMNYADKLYQPFQRLHSQSEFEGSGIGLATVKRIIDKHHGKIWAESTINQGTTFYFALPQ